MLCAMVLNPKGLERSKSSHEKELLPTSPNQAARQRISPGGCGYKVENVVPDCRHRCLSGRA